MIQFKSAALLIKTFVLISLTEIASFAFLICPNCRFIRSAFLSDPVYADCIAEQNAQISNFIPEFATTAWQFGVASLPAAAAGTALFAWVLRKQAVEPESVRAQASWNGPQHIGATPVVSPVADSSSGASKPDLVDSALRERLLDVAHELRNPLTVMRGQLDAIEDGIRRPDSASLSVFRHAVHRIDALLLDVESLAYGELQGLPFRMVPIHLGKLLDTLLASYGQALTLHGLTLDVSLDAGCRMDGDPERLCQAFDNLMQNSLRYTQAPGEIRIRLRDEGHAYSLTWEDSSPGVDPRLQPQLGRRGFRTSSDAAGQGLGLSIVRAIIETHGGGLRPQTSELGGLRWHVWLPADTRRRLA
jgi:two-component system sensor histidine kinase BaeS